jgi:hypothetical protein
MVSRTLRNRIIDLEQADSENMLGKSSADLPCGQGECVEIDESVVAAGGVDKLKDQVRNSREVTIQTKIENRTVDPPAIPSYLQDLFSSMIATMRAGNLELASKLENTNKELQSSVEQKI